MQFNVISLKKKMIKATAHGGERSPIHLQSLIVFFFFLFSPTSSSLNILHHLSTTH